MLYMSVSVGLRRRQWGCGLLISIVVVFLAMAVALLLQSNGNDVKYILRH